MHATAEFGMAGAWPIAVEWSGPRRHGQRQPGRERSMTSRLAILTHAAVLTATVAFAQVPSPEPTTAGGYVDPAHGLSVDAVVALALEQEPTLRASRADVEAVRALQEQASLRPNPSVSFAYQAEPGGTDRQTRIDGQWPLDLSRKDRSRQRSRARHRGDTARGRRPLTATRR